MAELVQLVVEGNEPARRLYEVALRRSAELHALKIDGRYYDDILMAKDLVRRGCRIGMPRPVSSRR